MVSLILSSVGFLLVVVVALAYIALLRPFSRSFNPGELVLAGFSLFSSTVLFALIYYMVAIPSGWLSGGGWLFFAIYIYGAPLAYLQQKAEEDGFVIPSLLTLITILLAALLFCFLFLSSPSILTYTQYQRQLGAPIKEGVRLPKLDINQAPLVSYGMAMAEAQKLLSQDPGLGSQVEIGRLAKQLVDGKLVWVGFLEPTGFFRWISTGYTPGYVKISATDPSDAVLVKNLKMRYLDQAYFNHNIERHAMFANFFGGSTGLTDFTPEINEKGRPYWVATMFRPEIGFSGANPIGVMTIDAQTGNVEKYDIGHAPSWVDRIQPAYIVKRQIAMWGEYVDGYWNTIFARNAIIAPSAYPDLIYGDNNRAYWFTGLTSTGNDNGIVGFMLTDSRTKATYQYTLPGANEDVAKQAVEGLVRANRYTATNPLVFEVQGVPTYVMTLTDQTGIARGYGLVDVGNYQVAVYGQSLADAVRSYGDRLHSNTQHLNQSVVPKTVTGVVIRSGVDIRGGTSTYLFMLSGVDTVLTGTSDTFADLPLVSVGDTLTVTFNLGFGDTSPIRSVDKWGKALMTDARLHQIQYGD